MSVAFYPGQTLESTDLNIIIRNDTGTPVDPFYIRYSLFDNTTGIPVLIGAPNRVPATTGVGKYYANATLPLDSNIGDWMIHWDFRETSGSPMVQVVQEFNVVDQEVRITVSDNNNMNDMIRRVRVLLRDNNPDRNYRFRPPASEKFLQSQAQVFGYIWEDEEILEYILMAIDDFNAAPPVTGVTIDSIPLRWRTAVILRACSFACFAIAMNWIADEFSVKGDEKVKVKDEEGNVYELSLEELFDVIYGDKILEMEKEVRDEYKKVMKELDSDQLVMNREKNTFVKTIKKVFRKIKDILVKKKAYNVDKIKESFYKGRLEVKSLSEDKGNVDWVPIKDIYRHNSLYKKMIKVVTDKGDVVVTDDHSLFSWETKKPIAANKLKIGYPIIANENNILVKAVIRSIEDNPAENYTYDLCVPGTESAFLSSGILVHNSYTISGVSLDVDKSAKYEGMKNNFITEYDKLKEQAKRSIKIIRGLRQPRYGVGISSALGPYSSPGVQARRNFISGFRN